MVLALLAGDLWLKYWSFESVAGVPIVLDRDPEDGSPRVSIEREDGTIHTRPRRDPADPASALPNHDPTVIIPSVLNLKLMINIGAVFGIGKGAQWFFAVVSVIATGVILYIFARSRASSFAVHVALALILSGALGNLYDRVLYGGVRDMLHLFPDVKLPFGMKWPGGADGLYPWIFNLADAALVCGVILAIILSWRHDTRQRRKQKAER
jgi:signal peptidase II